MSNPDPILQILAKLSADEVEVLFKFLNKKPNVEIKTVNGVKYRYLRFKEGGKYKSLYLGKYTESNKPGFLEMIKSSVAQLHLDKYFNKPKSTKTLREVTLGHMTFKEMDLLTNTLITGGIGSGKTSGALYPILSELLAIYNSETADPTDPYQKMGGLVLDLKGELFSGLLVKMYENDRDIFNDLVRIQPKTDYDLVEFLDEAGRKFYLSNEENLSDEFSNEVSLFYSQLGSKPNKRVAAYRFESEQVGEGPPITGATIKRATQEQLDYLKTIEITLKDAKPKLIGWRWEGEQLKRVLYNSRTHQEVFQTKDNAIVQINPPQRLKFNRLVKVSTGVRYNLCGPNVSSNQEASAQECAARLLAISGTQVENPYFRNAATRHLTQLIKLHEQIYPNSKININSLLSLTEPVELSEAIAMLEESLKEFKLATDKLATVKELIEYFRKEWETLDPKTAANIQAILINTFAEFMVDPNLKQIFSTDSTVNFSESINKGKVFMFTAGNYERLGRMIGRALKFDLQRALYNRIVTPEDNRQRIVLLLMDEAQAFLTTDPLNKGHGDENFFALSRQLRVCNLIATQSDSSLAQVFGKKQLPIFLQNFSNRIWFQTQDTNTIETASRLVGKQPAKKALNTSLANLEVYEALMLNKGRIGEGKVASAQLSPDIVSSQKYVTQRAEIIRYYFQGIIENRVYALGQVEQFNA